MSENEDKLYQNYFKEVYNDLDVPFPKLRPKPKYHTLKYTGVAASITALILLFFWWLKPQPKADLLGFEEIPGIQEKSTELILPLSDWEASTDVFLKKN